jgi:hypothetical protein
VGIRSGPDQVGCGSFWSDPDASRSFSCLQCKLSDSQANWNPRYGKAAESEIPDFTSMDALLNEV